MKKYFLLEMIAIILVSVVISGCNRSGKKVKGITSEGKVASVEVGVFDPVKMKNQIVEIIQKVPKGTEIVNMLNEAGASYIFDLTVPAETIEKMMTTTQKALGMGMYSFDTKYAAVYKRADMVLQTRRNVDQLSSELGLEEDMTIGKKYIDRFEKNKTNPDSLDYLTTQMSNEYHQYMMQGEHPDIYALGSIGANIEALHVLSQMTLLAKDKEKLLAVMNNQNERVQTLGTLLEIMSGDENVKPYYETIQPVIRFFEERETISADDLKTIVPLIETARGSILE
jgi:hypothetical protein